MRLLAQGKLKKFGEDVSVLAINANKRQIYSSTLQAKAYFELLRIIASMYNRMHVEHVSKSIDLVWGLSQVLKNES